MLLLRDVLPYLSPLPLHVHVQNHWWDMRKCDVSERIRMHVLCDEALGDSPTGTQTMQLKMCAQHWRLLLVTCVHPTSTSIWYVHFRLFLIFSLLDAC